MRFDILDDVGVRKILNNMLNDIDIETNNIFFILH